ncbi:C-reactive protein-like isoform X2 [Narcine bancroftii]|uniref:C-reactive protein-like isoform X2 n=1 Tax=Narcine bancroftii TaxID=1343680 RepID=UPI0038320EE9
MNPFIPIVLVICISLSGSESAGLAGKSLIFPTKTNTSFVKLKTPTFSKLSAFTVCFWAASEVVRPYALFSYSTSRSQFELLIWQDINGMFYLYLGDYGAKFSLPKANGLLRHICVTWESQGGVGAAWINGRRSLQKVGGKGQTVKGSGEIILGQTKDRRHGTYDINGCFVGEISDVNMWDHVLNSNQIKMLSQNCLCTGGNIIDWNTIGYTAAGNVKIQDSKRCQF